METKKNNIIKKGSSARFSKTISETDVYMFAGICGDFNPVHIDRVKAGETVFGKQIVHGALVSSFISTVIGMYMPGPGTIYISQESSFLKPVYIGDTVTAVVTVEEISIKRRAVLLTEVFNHNGDKVLTGQAKVLLP
ncbi:MAG: MaoC family dehydratase [Lachnospiraceae bacterium]|nr:MaoC family dehydratase [Lachnospiraceae bacterium]